MVFSIVLAGSMRRVRCTVVLPGRVGEVALVTTDMVMKVSFGSSSFSGFSSCLFAGDLSMPLDVSLGFSSISCSFSFSFSFSRSLSLLALALLAVLA